jgi:ubiquitin C-terminal hydrolase
MDKQLYLIDNFCKYKIKHQLLLLNNDIKNIFLKLAYTSLDMYSNFTSSKMNDSIIKLCIDVINTLENGPIVKSKIKFISAIANSCYMDSVLVCLLCPEIKYIDDIILKGTTNNRFCKSSIGIQKELRNIKYYLYGIKKEKEYTCRNIKNTFKDCEELKKFATSEIQDPTEFLSKLFDIFNTTTLKLSSTTYLSNDKINWESNEPVINDKVSVISVIDLKSIKKPSNKLLFISDFIEYSEVDELGPNDLFKKNDKKYKFFKKETKILYSDILIFNITRKDINGSFINYPIYPNEILLLNNKDKYYLCSCVIYTGYGHYIAYIKNNNDWYIYNDLDPVLRHIGSFNKMLKLERTPLRNGVIFVYNKFSN